ncbi:recombinase RecT [Janthinobacterium sp. CG_S6]|uniref:recombinase RecT n=1 Tax=Janthinobacterium sp. CG_S6 TaxID=3071707 RepID=UPI002DFE272C|nr:recombination protein RecT [Janthinobacterium sp. CG_S6]
MSNQVAVSPAKTLNDFMDKYKGQIALALPKHITADRMVRLTMTAFSQNAALQKCDMHSIFASVVVASQLGLEIGVGGQGYLVPYAGKATFVPGWQGLVDLVSRAGRATVWTGAVFQGDEFDWALGDRPFVKHRPAGGGDTWKEITHVYAVGRVNGSEYPVIEVWTMDRVVRHLNKFNKVGARHYALEKNGQNMEMYARKVVLLQVLKYMPKSVEVQRAVEVATAVDTGKSFTFDGEVVTVKDIDDQGAAESIDQSTGEVNDSAGALPICSDADFKKSAAAWREQITGKKKTVGELINFIQTRALLTEEQKLTIDSWSHEAE